MERYYYKHKGLTSVEVCNVIPPELIGHQYLDTKIGSSCCKHCKHCEDYSDNEYWIECSRIKEATGKLTNIKT